MTMNGKLSEFLLNNFNASSMKRGCAETIIAEVQEIVHRWHDYAEESCVNLRQRDKIATTLRMKGFP